METVEVVSVMKGKKRSSEKLQAGAQKRKQPPSARAFHVFRTGPQSNNDQIVTQQQPINLYQANMIMPLKASMKDKPACNTIWEHSVQTTLVVISSSKDRQETKSSR